MHMVWEESDVLGGLIVKRADVTEKWLVSYVYPPNAKTTHYALTSLSDGLISNAAGVSRADMARALTEEKLMPADVLATDSLTMIAKRKRVGTA